MSLVINAADAVAAEINAAPPDAFGHEFIATRRVLPVFELTDLTDLRVTVVPKGVEISGSTRSTSQYDISVDVGVQRKLTSDGGEVDAQIESLGELVDRIADYLRRRPLMSFPGLAWVSTRNEPVYAPEHLLE
jgi:hypothetical protein